MKTCPFTFFPYSNLYISYIPYLSLPVSVLSASFPLDLFSLSCLINLLFLSSFLTMISRFPPFVSALLSPLVFILSPVPLPLCHLSFLLSFLLCLLALSLTSSSSLVALPSPPFSLLYSHQYFSPLFFFFSLLSLLLCLSFLSSFVHPFSVLLFF